MQWWQLVITLAVINRLEQTIRSNRGHNINPTPTQTLNYPAKVIGRGYDARSKIM